ncbi:hypothetical protein GC194_04320 [bacterium]|nr:hypothetical protein [bacterium]
MRATFIIIFLISVFHGMCQNPLFSVRLNNKWGFVNTQGTVVIQPKYDAVGEFGQYPFAEFLLNGKLGLVNANGDEIYFDNINEIKIIDSSLLALRRDTLWGLYTANGKPLLDAKYSKIHKDANGLLQVTIGDSTGLKKPDGSTLRATKFLSVHCFSKTAYFAQSIDSCFVFTVDGQTIKSAPLGTYTPFDYPVCIYTEGDTEYAVNIENDKQSGTMERIKRLENSDFYILTSSTGEELFHPEKGTIFSSRFDIKCRRFITNKYLVTASIYNGLIDENGNIVLPLEFNRIELVKNKYIVVKNGLYGIYSSTGKLLTPCSYSYIREDERSGFFVLHLSGLIGVSKPDGSYLLPPAFSELEIESTQIRGRSGSELVFYDLDKNYNVADRYLFKNVKTMYLNDETSLKPSKYQPSAMPKALNFGWFRSLNNGLYGFRRSDSSLRHAPTFYEVKHFKNCQLTITEQSKDSKEKIKVLDDYYYQNKKSALAFTENGNYLLTPKYWHIFPSELRDSTCNYIKALRFDGKTQIVFRNGQVDKTTYEFVDTLVEGFARYNLGGHVVVSEEKNYKTNLFTRLAYRHYMGIDSNQNGQANRFECFKKFVRVDYGKWGFLAKDGSKAIEAKFDFVYPFYKGAAIVRYKNKWGVINTKGDFIIAPEFYNIDRIERNGKVFFHVFKPEPRFGIIDTTGDIKIYPEFLKAGNFYKNKLAVKIKSGWTYLDSNFFAFSAPNYQALRPFSNGRAAVQLNGKWGFISPSGTEVVRCIYNEVSEFNSQRAWVNHHGKWQIIDENGQYISEETFNKPTGFYKNVAFAQPENKDRFGLINNKGEYLIKPIFDNVSPFNKYGVAVVERKQKVALLHYSGTFVTDYQFDQIDSFSCGWAFATAGKESYILHVSGRKHLISSEYYEKTPFSCCVARVKRNGYYGYIDTSGNEIIACKLSKARIFSEGHAFAKPQGGRNTCYNTQGQAVFNFGGWPVYDFKEGRAILRYKGRSYYINTEGRILFNTGYKKALPFSQQVGRVKVGKKWQLINRHGHPLNAPKFVKIKNFNGPYGIVKRSGSYGLFRADGSLVLDVMYDEMNLVNNRYFLVSVQDRVGHYDLDNGWIWQPAK